MHKKEYNLQYSRCQYYCHNIWDYLDDKQLSVTTVHKLNTFQLYDIRLKCVLLERRIFLKSPLSKEIESSVKVFRPLLFLKLSISASRILLIKN